MSGGVTTGRGRSVPRRATAAAISVGAVAAAVAWWVSGTGPAARGVGPDPGCAAVATVTAASAPPARDGLTEHLVPVGPLPVGPVRAGVCRYAGDVGEGGVGGRPGRLVLGARLDAARTSEVAGWLDSLPTAQVDGRSCTGTAAVDVLTFGYAAGPDVRVVLRHGCGQVSNGVLVLPVTRDVVGRLEELLPVHR